MENNHDFVPTIAGPKGTAYSDFDPPAKGELQDSLPDGRSANSDKDVHTLALLGKKQVLKVRLS